MEGSRQVSASIIWDWRFGLESHLGKTRRERHISAHAIACSLVRSAEARRRSFRLRHSAL